MAHPAHVESITQAFEAWQAHNNKVRALGTDVAAWKILQDLHPHHHITRTEPRVCDLPGYAAAGHATATKHIVHGYDATRAYASTGNRMSGEPDTLKDQVGFGCTSYKWSDTDFIVYELSWPAPFSGREGCVFVLAEAEEALVKDGRHTTTDELLLAAGKWTRDVHEEIFVFDDEMWQKSKTLYKSVESTTWDDVVLDSTTKKSIDGDVHGFFDNKNLYTTYGVAWKRGIIFHGTPGNGKSMCIKALISTLSKRADPVPSLYVKSIHSCRGEKWCVKQVFAKARSMAPCLLIFEDLDSLVKDGTRSYFLNEVDGLESNDGILMIGSTNHLAKLDSAITKRPSRFDRKYRFNLPNEAERIAYCHFWRGKLTEAVSLPDEACEVVAKITEGFSFAYMKELFMSALLLLARGGPVEAEDLSEDEAEGDKSDDATGSRKSDDGVVVDKPVDVGEATPEKETEKKEVKTAKPKHAVYSLEIPESLVGNDLLKVLVAQTKVLCAQMDDSGNEPADKTGGLVPDFSDFAQDMIIRRAR